MYKNNNYFSYSMVDFQEYGKYLQYVSECFGNCFLFYTALKEAFEEFCKKGFAGSTSDQLLDTFCDNIFSRGGSANMSDEDIEKIEDSLEKVLNFVVNMNEKDLFEEVYRRKLARRLLFDKSMKYEHESILVTKLKQYFGNQFTSKMERMIEDLTSAKENQGHFEDYLKNNPDAKPGIDFTVTVLTAGSWPSYKSIDLNLPAEIVRCIEVFNKFYDQESTKKRKLTWKYPLCTCIIEGKFDLEPKELVVTNYQASVLSLFSESERLSYSDVKRQLNLPDEDIRGLLHSLSCAKYKILNKEPNTKTVAQADYFEFNSKFTDKMKTIQIPLPPVDDRKNVMDDSSAIDASIVRIMKRRKVLGHQQLVKECHVEPGVQIFKPDSKAIKIRIEDLITREYLEREKDDPSSYRYLP
ncbi:hypothetical protein SUGI_0792420 [Cryptomeria japonica]|nr:hypothetical protein SUGI_0792420 [Cryptomeria japonica]